MISRVYRKALPQSERKVVALVLLHRGFRDGLGSFQGALRESLTRVSGGLEDGFGESSRRVEGGLKMFQGGLSRV